MARSWPVGAQDGTIKLWSITSGVEIATLTGHRNGVLSVAFSPDELLASGSWDSNIKLWSIPEQQEIATLRGHVQSIRGVAFSPDGQLLANGEKTVDISPWAHGGITGIKVWSVSSRREIVTVKGAGPVSPDGQLLAGRAQEGIRRWNVDALISC